MPTFICPNCKYQTDGNELFCCKCGTKITSVPDLTFSSPPDAELESGYVVCKTCGIKHEKQDLFCGKCGTNITETRRKTWRIVLIIFIFVVLFILGFIRGYNITDWPHDPFGF